MTTDVARLTPADARALIEAALTANGVAPEAALSVAQALAAAEAEGQVGHGFSRLEDYIAQAKSGKINPQASIQSHLAAPSSLVVDADHGFAYPAMDVAIAKGIEIARAQGVAMMAIRNSHHCGALSIQVERIAKAGLVGLMMANTPAAIAPWGAKAALFGTNPIAFAAPRVGQPPLVIDLSLSTVARGKVLNAKKTGQAIPAGWALDADGQPTTDPDAALAGSMMPIGGAKGTALALMVEILSAVLSASTLSAEAASFFNPEGPPPGVGQWMMAIQPPDGADFGSRLEHLFALVAAADGARLPGQRRLQALAEAEANGIAVNAGYVAAARRLAGWDEPA